mgnify:CR=1 FL=1|tara:strand:- start:7423 stop:8493 length:1071 start_codon:yes stop_codon:yes gene_type:complete
MNIIFDNIIFSLQKSGGISVYWFELISRFLKESEMDNLFLEGNEGGVNIFRNKLGIQSKYILDSKDKYFIPRYRDVDLNIVDCKFIFHSSYYRTLSRKTKKYNKVRQVVTVHDFTYELFTKGIKKWTHTIQKKKAIKAADIVICISENTKKDLLHFYPEFASKDIRVIYNGVSEEYYTLPLNIKVNKKVCYFLFVGSRASYKNFYFAIEAISQTKDFVLKIVGPKLTEIEIELLNKYLSQRWGFLENIDNSKLNQLYNEAFALLYPSSYEGFGIPLLEAMKTGCPFIAMNCSSIPEVAGEAGVLLENLSYDQFNIAIATINKERNKIVSKGLEQANKFSWDKCYTETLKVYEELIK